MDEAYEKIIDFIKNNYKKMILPIIIILVYIIGFLFLYYKINNNASDDNNNSVAIEKVANDEVNEEEIITDIYIDVKGSVINPGVYKLNNNSRVIDAITAAGGISEDANTRFINLSKKVNDGDVILIYSNKEKEESKKENIIYVETPCICEEVENSACYIEEENNSSNNTSNNQISNNTSNEQTSNTISNKININTASIEELTTLSGIGEAKAKAIIEYREVNGLFKNIEDLVNVSGISETLFSKIKESITV